MEKTDQNLINLSIIWKVQPGDKISLNKDNILAILKPGYFNGVYRWYSLHSRKESLKNLDHIVKNTLRITNQLINECNEDNKITQPEESVSLANPSLTRYLSTLNMAIVGLNSLVLSYTGDETTCQCIESYKRQLRDQCNTIESILRAGSRVKVLTLP